MPQTVKTVLIDQKVSTIDFSNLKIIGDIRGDNAAIRIIENSLANKNKYDDASQATLEYYHGKYLFRTKQYEKSYAAFQRFFIHPAANAAYFADAHYTCAKVALHADYYAAAVEHLNLCLKLNANFPKAEDKLKEAKSKLLDEIQIVLKAQLTPEHRNLRLEKIFVVLIKNDLLATAIPTIQFNQLVLQVALKMVNKFLAKNPAYENTAKYQGILADIYSSLYREGIQHTLKNYYFAQSSYHLKRFVELQTKAKDQKQSELVNQCRSPIMSPVPTPPMGSLTGSRDGQSPSPTADIIDTNNTPPKFNLS